MTNSRRKIIVIESGEEIIRYCIEHFVTTANNAIREHGNFFVALSGGTTPSRIYAGLAAEDVKKNVDWSKVWLFWSDERAVPPSDKESNFLMSMEAGLSQLPIPSLQINRMIAENDIEQHALEYEQLIKKIVPCASFDLMMLGMGEDGHTASLFPKTDALRVTDKLVVSNFIPQKNTWRMTMTYPCINLAKTIVVYVIGKNKTEVFHHVVHSPYDPENLPIQKVGTEQHPALYITDIGS